MRPLGGGADVMQRSGSAVAEKRARSGREDSCHPAPFRCKPAVADGIGAAVHAVQAPVVEPPCDRASSEPERDELRVRDEAVLALRELPDRPVHGARCLFCIYAMQKWLLAGHPRIVTVRVYRRTRGMRRNRLPGTRKPLSRPLSKQRMIVCCETLQMSAASPVV